MLELFLTLLAGTWLTPWLIVWVLGFYYFAVFALSVYRAHLNKRLRWWHYIAFSPPIVLFLLLDLVTNLSLAWYVFKDRPHEALVTQRLARYRTTLLEDDPKRQLAEWICDQNLDIFDPGHC